MPTITNPKNDRRTITHRGNDFGEDNVELKQNVADSYTPILEFTGPDKYERIDYAAGVHPTRAELRAMESFDVGDDDSSGTLEEGERTLSLSTNIVPIAGEYELDDQPFPVVVVVNTTQDTEIEAPDGFDVDYATNEVVVAESEVAAGDTVKVYPVISDGKLQYRAIDQFGHQIGSLDEWGTPVHTFADHDYNHNDSMVHLVGRMTWETNETLAVYVEAPQQVVWEDDDFPDAYVSKYSQDVDVSV